MRTKETAMTSPGQLPAECALIRATREAVMPALSMRQAARRASELGARMSATYWRRCESGAYLPRVPAAALAYQAAVTGATPEELSGAGRPDGAAALRALLRRQQRRQPEEPAAPAGPAGLEGVMAQILEGLADIDGSTALTAAQKAELREELVAGIVRDAAERKENLRAMLRITGGRAVS
jgi:hypothetical protein